MFLKHNDTILDVLKESSLFTQAQLSELEEVSVKRGSVVDFITYNNWTTQDQFWSTVTTSLGYVFLRELPDALEDIQNDSITALLKGKRVWPLRETASRLDLLVYNPFDIDFFNSLSFLLKKDVRLHITIPDKFNRAFQEAHSRKSIQFSDWPINNSIIEWVDGVLLKAVKAKASDIHFESFNNSFHVRFRIDGVLSHKVKLSSTYASPVVARLKVMANLDITEKKKGQDGRFSVNLDNKETDFRISTLPTQTTESVVIRILDTSFSDLNFKNLGFASGQADKIMKIANLPSGIFLIVGPTGSGKTTTISTILKELNEDDLKILTAEDPVEYEQEGIMQMSLKNHNQVNFPDALRAFLRHDPDKIMIGEIRDIETAKVAIQASLTGHMVFSTLHTHDATGAVSRLIDLGIEPYVVATALSGILTQRLVRRICDSCKDDYHPVQAEVDKVNKCTDQLVLFHGLGCPQCNFTGYRGRVLITELFEVNDNLRNLISSNSTKDALYGQMKKEGIRTLAESAFQALSDGVTTIDEVYPYFNPSIRDEAIF